MFFFFKQKKDIKNIVNEIYEEILEFFSHVFQEEVVRISELL